ncbi:MAG: carboxylating nicotinate-nucleotide diphosphorylase [Pseudomonadales bacterium]|nr:carboxylating nicotinate-nucleotide diphosphorylase [Pseudomonadales bacterium]
MFTPPDNLAHTVQIALAEDLGPGDITAELLPESKEITAIIECREAAVVCGIPWVNEVYAQLDSKLVIEWSINEGDRVKPSTTLALIKGPARAILSGERTALNFLQTLSATATQTNQLVNLVSATTATLLDTRKTIPGLRTAQKYAVRVGGGTNHRQGLFDAYLIKENHISACGGIVAAITNARNLHPDKTLEVEVKDLEELKQALEAHPDIVMLDNFSLENIEQAVSLNSGPCKLEASGGINAETLVNIAETGVDYISVGSLTKNCQAIDLSLLVQD